MAPRGFAIRCPHCFEWSSWPDALADVAILDDAEWKEILQGLRDDPESYQHPKMLRCKDPKGQCPAPFQCFLCSNPSDAHRYVGEVPTWMLRRAFRPYKAPRGDRWPSHGAIMFCNSPVARRDCVQLELALDRELLSRAILGIRQELEAPVTVYSATVFQTSSMKRLVWVPVGAYRKGSLHVPPGYNPLCNVCRAAAIKHLLGRFQGTASPSNCPAVLGEDGKCAGREAACLKGDWNHCPAFLDARRSLGLCYDSDCKIIAKVEQDWVKHGSAVAESKESTCWAGLREMAVPIIVHDRLAGVAMTGQFVVGDASLHDIGRILADSSISDIDRDEIRMLAELLEGKAQPTKEQERWLRRFRITREQFDEKTETLIRNAERIAAAAEAHYRDSRARSEAVFRQEVLGRIDHSSVCRNHLSKSVAVLLERMRRFWSFMGVYLLACDTSSRELTVLAASTKEKGPINFPYRRKKLGTVEADLSRTHPAPWLYDAREGNWPTDPWIGSHQTLVLAAQRDPDLSMPVGRYYFFVFVPFADQLYSFIFAVRDESSLHPPRTIESSGISDFCQEAILETCAEAIRKLGEFWHDEARARMLSETWHRVSARAAHAINNELFVARGSLRRLGQGASDGVKECVDDINAMIVRVGQVCKSLTEYAIDSPPQPKEVDPKQFILRTIAHYAKATPDHRFETKLADALPRCTWDARQMGRALGELLHNAVVHTPAGGAIEICAGAFADRCVDMVRITISNEGVGVPEGLKRKVFLPYVTTLPDGTGLGLAIVAQIVEKHGGRAREEGVPGENAKFVIEIPVHMPLRRKR